MIIDCHGHYTTTPPAHDRFRRAQLAALRDAVDGAAPEAISDDEVRESIESNQLAIMRERGTDVMVISPKASAMAHDVPDAATARQWATVSNDLVHRVVELFPDRFAGVCQLPQTPEGALDDSIAELRRAVGDLGFVGCNLNPDPSGGNWAGPPMTDEHWYPLYEAMEELRVPAMIHVSASRNRNAHSLGAHYLNADTSVYMQLVEHDLFTRFPGLRFVIPHGGGAVPYHWGRFRGLASRLGRPDPVEALGGNVFFDTCVYNAAGIRLLIDVVDPHNILFASEMLGAVPRVQNPETGRFWDDTKAEIDDLGLEAETAALIFEQNARRVYPRLDQRLRALQSR